MLFGFTAQTKVRIMARNKLPDRRQSVTISGKYAGTELAVTIGMFPDGSPGEVFGNIGKAGSELERTMNDACVAVSIALQHGASVESIAKTIAAREPWQEPSSIVAAVIGILAEYDHERAA